MKLRLGVIFGGESVEHEVSIITAVQAMKAIDEEKYEIIPLYITKDREWYTGKLLKDIEIYKDLDLLKKYATNVVLTNKKDKFVLIKKTGLKRIIGLDTLDTSHITNMSQMFQDLSSLTTLDLSSFNTSNVTNSDDMFKNCTSLTTGYARTQADATMFNNSTNKPNGVTFAVKS